MATVTICPDCKREHALFYYVDAAGEKTLNFLCNRKERFTVENKFGDHDQMRYTHFMHQVEFVEGLDIPVKWSRQYAKKEQDKQQGTLL